MRVNTFGSVSARSEVSLTSQPVTSCPLFLRITTTSYAVQPPVPRSTISMGRGARLRPPPSGAPSIATTWLLPVSARKVIPSPVQRTVQSIGSPFLSAAGAQRNHCPAANFLCKIRTFSQFPRMKTYTAKAGEVQQGWFLVDAQNKVLGRLAVQIAARLRGKHKPQ